MPPTLDTTTNNAFRYPTDANNGPDFATGLANFASDVDGMWSSGTLSARPTAGVRNRVYYATDTGQLYQDSGSAWGLLNVTTPWVNLTLNPFGGTGAVSPGILSPRIRLEGDVARVDGVIKNNSASTWTFSTGVVADGPMAYMPVTGFSRVFTFGAVSVKVQNATPNVWIYVSGVAAGALFDFEGITYPVT